MWCFCCPNLKKCDVIIFHSLLHLLQSVWERTYSALCSVLYLCSLMFLVFIKSCYPTLLLLFQELMEFLKLILDSSLCLLNLRLGGKLCMCIWISSLSCLIMLAWKTYGFPKNYNLNLKKKSHRLTCTDCWNESKQFNLQVTKNKKNSNLTR